MDDAIGVCICGNTINNPLYKQCYKCFMKIEQDLCKCGTLKPTKYNMCYECREEKYDVCSKCNTNKKPKYFKTCFTCK